MQSVVTEKISVITGYKCREDGLQRDMRKLLELMEIIIWSMEMVLQCVHMLKLF